MLNIWIFAVAIIAGCVMGWAVSFYSGYRVAVGPEEDERDPVEVRKSYKWRVDSPEAKILPAAAVLWVLFAALMPNDILKWILYSAAAVILLGVSFVDWKIFEIPPLYDVLIAILGAVRLFTDLSHWYDYSIGAVTVSGLFLLIALVSRGRAMGGGDIKLTAAMGLLLGWEQILMVMTIGALLGAVIHGILMAVTKKEHMLAFGPYLAAAGIIVMCAGERILNWYLGYITATLNG